MIQATTPSPALSERGKSRLLLVEINEDGTVGGSHQALLDLVERLRGGRYDPVVLVYQDSDFVSRLRASGLPVLVWDQERAHERRAGGGILGRLGRGVGRVHRRWRLLRRLDIDLIHINNSPAVTWSDWLPAARLAGVPIISHVRGYPLPPGERGVARWACARFDRLLAISDFILQELRQRAMPENRLRLVPDGVDAEAVRARATRPAGEVRTELDVRADELLLVMAGHLREWKGQDVVLTALGLLPPTVRSRLRVAFAGADDPFSPGYRDRLDQLVRDHGLGDRVRFLGARRDVPDLMRAADLVLHASTTAEPFGLVVVEALALGRPVVASRLGGPGGIVTDAVGWTFDPTRPEDLAGILDRIVADPTLLSQRSRAAAARAEAFSIGRTLEAVTAVYDQLLPATAVPSR